MEKKYVLDQYAQRVADICRVPIDTVVKLREMGMLDALAVRNALIYHDYWILKNSGKLTSHQIYERLSIIYNVKKTTAYNAVKAKKHNKFYCRICGAGISRTTFATNGGVCDRCIAHNIISDNTL